MRGGEERLGAYTYRWDEHCFPLGADSLALGEFCSLQAATDVLDLGCGAGLLLLLCARRGCRSLTGVELDPHAAHLARENLERNGLEGDILTGDLRTAPLPEKVDLVVCNPPWYPAGQKGDAARVEGCTLPELCAVAAKTLRHRGRFAVAYPPERLANLLVALRLNDLEPKRLQLCRHRRDRAPYAVLVEATKGGNPGLDILPDRLEDSL